MNSFLQKATLTLSSVILLSGCASSFKSISPETFNFQSENSTKNVKLSYSYNVLQERGNTKYARRELKTQNHIVAVKIKNNSGKDLVFNEDVKLLSNDIPATIVAPEIAFEEVKQSVPIYLLYLLLTPTKLTITDESGQKTSFPLGFMLGPAISGGNMIIAGTANGKFKEELTSYNLLGKNIKNGETAYGLIAVKSAGYNPLTLQILTATDSTNVSQKN